MKTQKYIIKAENKITGEITAKSDIKFNADKAHKLSREWNEEDTKCKYYTVQA